ncbi:MAG: 6,7-dimethyl-8-ribityllumazine synthase [Paracoccaceae bacterium]
MTSIKYAFIKAAWHAPIVDQALAGFCDVIPAHQVEVFQTPGAFEMPLLAKELANSQKYGAIIAAALVVDGGIYRHEFVAQSVVTGLMQVGLETGLPVLSVSLTPKDFHETDHHIEIFKRHFFGKGQEAAQAVRMLQSSRQPVTVAPSPAAVGVV